MERFHDPFYGELISGDRHAPNALALADLKIARLEHENAALRAEIERLKRTIWRRDA